mgnify:CR=1 FL=1
MNIIAKRKRFYGLSLVLIAIGLIALAVRGFNLGIDFKSGTIIELNLQESFTTGEVRDVLKPFGLESASIRSFGTSGTEVEIRTEILTDQQLTEIREAFRAKWPNLTSQVPAQVDPIFSLGLVRQALMALALASVGMIIYISWRFEFKFAIAAIVALLHDVLLVVGIFAVFQIEVNSEFIAAILTIVGYSINDTIVIFDRIRENQQLAKRRTDLGELVNQSVAQSISRTINTSVTTLLAIGAVLLFGGVTLRPLATALVVGVIVGTYSSIFIASSLWYDWKLREQARHA